jgi:hypothetical protein
MFNGPTRRALFILPPAGYFRNPLRGSGSNMNCLYETVAEAYMRVRSRFVPAIHDDLGEAEESLEACRANLASKEREAAAQCAACTRAAIARRKAGDVGGAKFHLQAKKSLFRFCRLLKRNFYRRFFPQERKRAVARLEKVRNGMALLDKQLDALRSSTIDKELMNSLRASSQAMKRAGIGMDAEEAEKVMNDLEDQIHEASEVTNVLATPLNALGDSGDADAELQGLADVDVELGLIEEEDTVLLGGLSEPLLPDAPTNFEPAVVRAPPVPSAMAY